MIKNASDLINPSASLHPIQEGLQGILPLPPDGGQIGDLGGDFSLTCSFTETSPHLLEKICGNEAKYIELFCKNCGKLITLPIRCHKRTCKDCSQKKSARLLFKYQDIAISMQNPKLITLTVPWVKDLRKGVREMAAAWGKLRRQKCFKNSIRGSIAGFHFLPKPGGLWFVHMHILVDSIYISQKKLSLAWHKVTGTGYIVDIRKAWSQKGGLKYILGYITATKHLVGHKDDVNDSLQNLKTVFTGGSCYNVPTNSPRLICTRCHGHHWGTVECDSYEPQQLENAYFQNMQTSLCDYG